jgi:hypothetical protein
LRAQRWRKRPTGDPRRTRPGKSKSKTGGNRRGNKIAKRKFTASTRRRRGRKRQTRELSSVKPRFEPG